MSKTYIEEKDFKEVDFSNNELPIAIYLIGDDVEKGLLPNDLNCLGKMIGDICYHNANKYFEF